MTDQVNDSLPDFAVRDEGWVGRVQLSPRMEQVLAERLPGVDVTKVRFAAPASRPRVALGAQPSVRCSRCGQPCWWTPGDDPASSGAAVLCMDCCPRELLRELVRSALEGMSPTNRVRLMLGLGPLPEEP